MIISRKNQVHKFHKVHKSINSKESNVIVGCLYENKHPVMDVADFNKKPWL